MVKFISMISYFIRQTAVSANDGQWHHICLTWESSAGSWKMYKDGKVAASGKGFKTGISFLLRLAVNFREKCEYFN